MTDLFPAPQVFTLPLSKGGDLSCEFVYKPDDTEADWPAGATVTLTIDAATPITSDATIDGSTATVLVDHAEVDGVKNGTLWRLVMTTTDTIDTVMANGKVARKDGTS